MAGRIANWIKRPTPERPDITEAANQLRHLGETRPDLREAATLQAVLLRAAYAEPISISKIDISSDDAIIRFGQGMPLLRGVPLPVDKALLQAQFVRLAAACRELDGAVGKSGEALHRLARQNKLDAFALAQAMVNGQAQDVPAELEAADLPVELTLALLRFTLLPVLEAAITQLAPLRSAAAWQHGYCPTCGAWLLLAEQRGLEMARFARCGLCTSSWPIDRVACAFCGNRDHRTLNYFHVESEAQRQRVAACDECGYYLKLRSTLQPFRTPQLLHEEIALVHLDLIAIDKGYMPPS